MSRSVTVKAALLVIALCLFLMGAMLFPGGEGQRASASLSSVGSLLGADPFFDFSPETIKREFYPAEPIGAAFNYLRNSTWVSRNTEQKCSLHFSRFVSTNNRFVEMDSSRVVVLSDRSWYYRFHLIKLIAFPGSGLPAGPLYAVLYKDGKLVYGAGKQRYFPFIKRNGHYVASLNAGFSPKLGKYVARVFSAAVAGRRSVTLSFEIRARKLRPVRKGFSVMTMESAIPMRYQMMRGPFGKRANYRAFFSWAKILGADAFWILGSQVSGKDRGLSPKNPLCKATLGNVKLLSKAAKKYGIDFGAYVISYYTPHRGMDKAGYIPSMRYQTGSGEFVVSEHTSLASRKRFYDLVRFARKMKQNKNVSYVGFDFIRTGHSDGFEMTEMVVDDMNVVVPANWSSLSKKAKMSWFARQVLVVRDSSLIDRWRWWRAHRVASIINGVIRNAGLKKPVWVFTLGWEHGKQHGQDPYMMLDAGCFIDAAMLYEANELQFGAMKKQWSSYIDSRYSSIITGNCVDYKLNPSSKRAPIVEFYRRSLLGFSSFSKNGYAKGVFWHDVARAIWGRTGENSGGEWAMVGGSAVTKMREMLGFYSFKVELPLYRSVAPGKSGVISVVVRNHSKRTLKNLVVNLLPCRVFSAHRNKVTLKEIPPNSFKRVSFAGRFRSAASFASQNVYAVTVSSAGVRHYLKHGFLRRAAE